MAVRALPAQVVVGAEMLVVLLAGQGAGTLSLIEVGVGATGGQSDLQLLNSGVSPSLRGCVSSFLKYFARGMYISRTWRPKTAQWLRWVSAVIRRNEWSCRFP